MEENLSGKSILPLKRFYFANAIETFAEVASFSPETYISSLTQGFQSARVSLSRVSVEELECLATWKEGSSRYLVGRLHHGHASSNEDRYRCFVYEKAGQTVQGNLNRAAMGIGAIEHEVALPAGPVPEGSAEVYRVAQSGDATCNGLFSPMEGSRTMTLRKGEFPGFFFRVYLFLNIVVVSARCSGAYMLGCFLFQYNLDINTPLGIIMYIYNHCIMYCT